MIAPHPSSIRVVSTEEFTTAGAVAAFQVSSPPYNAGYKNRGYIAAVREDGTGIAMEVGPNVGATPVWTEDGLFFSATDEEMLVTDDGLTRLPRPNPVAHELMRWPLPDVNGFLSFSSYGFVDGEILQRLTLGNADGVREIDVHGQYMDMGMCEESAYAITSTRLTPGILDDVTSFARDRGTALPNRATMPAQEVLVRVYPETTSHYPSIVGLAREDERVTGGNQDMPCAEGVIYRPIFLRDHAHVDKDSGLDAKAGHAALQAWNTTDGTATVIDLVTPEGGFLDLTEDDFTVPMGRFVNGRYVFITRQTRSICSTELATGVTECDLVVDRTDGEGHIDVFAMTDDYAYILNQGDGEEGPAFALSRYSFATGARDEVLTIEDAGVLREYDMSVQGLAINPKSQG
ncbi:hypothetical protein M3T53_06000 [Actinomyces sp. B33]|uniref:hypothetical protein n=1 Tax=Actinomyces sp. B33 TaxID=2942131 RepID=UPI0023424F2A|nr:hypothetical protein [Actinomyces sp. B33]MDC4233261.1 hypothetical protein [Actinomyces sp. B33]